MAKRKKAHDLEGAEVEEKIVRGLGDNAPEKPISGKKLRGFIDHIHRLDRKKDQVLQEIREVYADAKAVGYDGKTIRTIVREEKMEPEKREEQEELLALYKSALGLLNDD